MKGDSDVPFQLQIQTIDHRTGNFSRVDRSNERGVSELDKSGFRTHIFSIIIPIMFQ